MTRKTAFFEERSWIKFNNLGLALGTNLKLYTSVAKRIRIKSQKVLGAKFYVCGSYRGKTGRGAFLPPPPPPAPSWIGLINIEIIRYFSCEPRFNVVFPINNFLRIKDRMHVIKVDDKKIKEQIAFHYVLMDKQLCALIL